MVDSEELRRDAHGHLRGGFSADVEADWTAHATEGLRRHPAGLQPVAEAPPLRLASDEAHVACLSLDRVEDDLFVEVMPMRHDHDVGPVLAERSVGDERIPRRRVGVYLGG